MKLKTLIKPKEPPVPPGTHPCVCFGVVDFGDQLNKIANKYQRRIRFLWEVSDVMDSEGKPRELSREFTATFDKRGSLRGFLTGWLGIPDSEEALGELEVFNLIGVPGFMTVVLNETGEFSNITALSPLVAGYPAPQATRPPIRWDMEQWNDAVFNALPEWIQARIKLSTQYQKEHPPTTTIDFAALSAAQAQQSAAPAVQLAQPVQQYAAPAVQQNAQPVQQQAAPQFTQQAASQSVQQTAPPPVQQTQQSAYAAPAAPGAVNQQAYQIPYQGAGQPAVTQAAPVVQPQQPIVQQGANTGGVPF